MSVIKVKISMSIICQNRQRYIQTNCGYCYKWKWIFYCLHTLDIIIIYTSDLLHYSHRSIVMTIYVIHKICYWEITLKATFAFLGWKLRWLLKHLTSINLEHSHCLHSRIPSGLHAKYGSLSLMISPGTVMWDFLCLYRCIFKNASPCLISEIPTKYRGINPGWRQSLKQWIGPLKFNICSIEASNTVFNCWTDFLKKLGLLKKYTILFLS